MCRSLSLPCFVFVGFLLMACPLWAEDNPEGHDFIQTHGRDFVTADGMQFAIKSIGLGNWLVPEGYMFKFHRMRSPTEINALFEYLIGADDTRQFWEIFRAQYIQQADIRFIKAAGFNTVRVPLHYKLFMDNRKPDPFVGPGWALLDQLIDWCKQAGLKVILDLHAAPGGQTGVNHDDGTGFPLVFYVPQQRRMTLALWQHLAERYHNESSVLGYELLNEPISSYNDENTLNPRLEPLYKELASAIRAVDPHHILFLSPAQWDQNFEIFGQPFAPNLAYVYHEFWCGTERDAVQTYANFGLRYNVPIVLGEAGEFNDQWNHDFRLLNERFNIGWSFWAYKEMDASATVVSTARPQNWNKITALGDLTPDQWPSLPPIPRAEAKAILWDYLESLKIGAGTINHSYLASLGLEPDPSLE